MTALNEAVFYNVPHLTKLLLDYGADCDIEDDGGTLPLWFAVDSCQSEMIQLLINVQSRISIRSTLSNSCKPCNPLEHAVHKQIPDTVILMTDVYCEEAQNCLKNMEKTIDSFSSINTTTKDTVKMLANEIRPLMMLSRNRIRVALGKGKQGMDKVPKLKLPNVLKNFLLYDSIDPSEISRLSD